MVHEFVRKQLAEISVDTPLPSPLVSNPAGTAVGLSVPVSGAVEPGGLVIPPEPSAVGC